MKFQSTTRAGTVSRGAAMRWRNPNRGPGCVFLGPREVERYPWYREVVWPYRPNRQVSLRPLRDLEVVAAVIVSHHPGRPRGTRFTVHYFGLRECDLQRTRGPRYQWSAEGVSYSEICGRITSHLDDRRLLQAAIARNRYQAVRLEI